MRIPKPSPLTPRSEPTRAKKTSTSLRTPLPLRRGYVAILVSAATCVALAMASLAGPAVQAGKPKGPDLRKPPTEAEFAGLTPFVKRMPGSRGAAVAARLVSGEVQALSDGEFLVKDRTIKVELTTTGMERRALTVWARAHPLCGSVDDSSWGSATAWRKHTIRRGSNGKYHFEIQAPASTYMTLSEIQIRANDTEGRWAAEVIHVGVLELKPELNYPSVADLIEEHQPPDPEGNPPSTVPEDGRDLPPLPPGTEPAYGLGSHPVFLSPYSFTITLTVPDYFPPLPTSDPNDWGGDNRFAGLDRCYAFLMYSHGWKASKEHVSGWYFYKGVYGGVWHFTKGRFTETSVSLSSREGRALLSIFVS